MPTLIKAVEAALPKGEEPRLQNFIGRLGRARCNANFKVGGNRRIRLHPPRRAFRAGRARFVFHPRRVRGVRDGALPFPDGDAGVHLKQNIKYPMYSHCPQLVRVSY